MDQLQFYINGVFRTTLEFIHPAPNIHQDRSVLKTLNEKLDEQEQRVKELEDQIKEDVKTVKRLLSRDRRKEAENALKLKKVRESEVASLNEKIIKARMLATRGETAKFQWEVFDTMKTATAQFKAVIGYKPLDQVEKQMDEYNEMMAQADEFNKIFESTPTIGINETEISKELDELEKSVKKQEESSEGELEDDRQYFVRIPTTRLNKKKLVSL